MRTYKDVKDRLLSEPKVREAYDELAGSYTLASKVIRARLEAGLTQKELAEKIGTHQSNISRLESGKCTPTFQLLAKVAEATGRELKIDLL